MRFNLQVETAEGFEDFAKDVELAALPRVGDHIAAVDATATVKGKRMRDFEVIRVTFLLNKHSEFHTVPAPGSHILVFVRESK